MRGIRSRDHIASHNIRQLFCASHNHHVSNSGHCGNASLRLWQPPARILIYLCFTENREAKKLASVQALMEPTISVCSIRKQGVFYYRPRTIKFGAGAIWPQNKVIRVLESGRGSSCSVSRSRPERQHATSVSYTQ